MGRPGRLRIQHIAHGVNLVFTQLGSGHNCRSPGAPKTARKVVLSLVLRPDTRGIVPRLSVAYWATHSQLTEA